MTINEFEKQVIRETKDFATVWSNNINCQRYGERHFIIYCTHSWGTAYCDWSRNKNKLINKLKEIGAVNIRGRIEWNRIDLEFDMRKSLISKED